jgi:hypothetical protein
MSSGKGEFKMNKINLVFLTSLVFTASMARAVPLTQASLKECAALGHVVELQVGDPYCDGHCFKELYPVCSNKSPGEINAAYRTGTDLVGFDLTVSVAREYEDPTISALQLAKLKSAGIHVELIDHDSPNAEGAIRLSADEFVEIYVEILKLANKDLKLQQLKFGTQLNIGGYGLQLGN